MPNTPPATPGIMVAPLNWGLGHATRCVPLVRALEERGQRVVLASDGAALQLLKAEFPHLPAFTLPSYHIRYKTRNMVWNIAGQLPRITYAIRTEQWATARLAKQHHIKGIISDNRYGCFSSTAHNVLLTHQIHLRIPNAALQWTANLVLQRAFQKFDEVWVPDAAGEPSLSGELSHPPLRHPDVQYIGMLSRFHTAPYQSLRSDDTEKRIAVVLSGPEPQRSYLEQALLEQALDLPYRFVFVRGKPQAKTHEFIAENIERVSYLTAAELLELYRSADAVVCRAGYSSLMDLVAFGHLKALIVPTPGQTEQEYLAQRFAASGMCVAQNQEHLNLRTGLEALEKCRGFQTPVGDGRAFEPVLDEWLEKITSR